MADPKSIVTKLGLNRIARRGLTFELLLGLSVQGGGAVSGFLMTLIVARGFGAEVLGQYQLALTTVMLLALVAVQGLDQLIVRQASAAFARGEEGSALNFFNQARKRQAVVALPLTLFLVLVADFVAEDILGEPDVAQNLRILAPAVLGLALIRSCSAFLRAKGNVLVSQSLLGFAYTTVAILLLGSLLAFDVPLPIIAPSVAYLTGIIVIVILSYLLVARVTREIVAESGKAALATGILIAGFSVLANFNQWLGLFLLTAFRDAAEAGIYRVGFQICLLFALVNGAFASMAGPHLARAFDRKDAAESWKIVRNTGMVGIAIAAPLLIAILLAAEEILSLFGDEFISGALALRVLALGQFVNVAVGPAAASLTMMNRERDVFIIELCTVAISIAVLLAMLPQFGMVATATAVALAAALRNIASLVLLRRLLSSFR